MKANHYPVLEELTYAANRSVQLPLPKHGFITDLNLTLVANITAGAAPVPKQDALFRMLKSIKITGAGAKNFWDMVDGRQLKLDNISKYGTHLREDALPAATVTADVEASMPIHWGFESRNVLDKTMVLPARDISNIALQIDWADATALGAQYTINSMKLIVDVHEIVLGDKESVKSVFPNGLITMKMESHTKEIQSLYSGLSLQDQVPIGDTIYQSQLLVLNAANDRSNSDVSEISIKYTRINETPYHQSWNSFRSDNQRKYDFSAVQEGMGIFDWPLITMEKYGRNAGNDQINDVIMGFSTSATGGRLITLHKIISSM